MNRFVMHLCVPLLLLLTLSPAADSQTKRDDSAIEKVVATSMESSRKMDWKAYAEFVHPESLQDYKNMWLRVLQAAVKKGPEEQADLLPLFDKAADIKSVLSMKPKEFFASSMKGMASQFRDVNISPLNVDEKIIGTVREGDDRAYVVVRTRTKNKATEITRVELITLKRSDKEWRMMLPDVVRIMAETFKRTGQNTQKSGPVKDRADPDK
jgi:hypothetical protein